MKGRNREKGKEKTREGRVKGGNRSKKKKRRTKRKKNNNRKKRCKRKPDLKKEWK